MFIPANPYPEAPTRTKLHSLAAKVFFNAEMEGEKKYSPPRGMTHFAVKSSSWFDAEISGLAPTISRGVPTPIMGSMPGAGTAGTAFDVGGNKLLFAQAGSI